MLISVILILAITIPLLYKDEIVQLLKDELSSNIEGEVKIGDGSLSLFRHFPDLEIRLEDVFLQGKELTNMKYDSLLSIGKLSVTTDFRSLFRKNSPIVINGIFVENGKIQIHENASGLANYQIFKNQENVETEKPADLEFLIEDFAVDNLTLKYKNDVSGLTAGIEELSVKGVVNFLNQNVKVSGAVESQSVNIDLNGINYAKDLKLDAVLEGDLSNSFKHIVINSERLMLNQMSFDVGADLLFENDETSIDFAISNKGDQFSDLLSLLPNAYTSQFKKVESRGSLQFQSSIKGVLAPDQNKYPKYRVQLNVKDGYFKYPGFALPVSDIEINADIANGSSWNVRDINIPEFQFILNNELVSGALNVKSADTNPKVESKLIGKIGLDHLYQAYPFPQFSGMSGMIDFDWLVDADQKMITDGKWSDIKADGKTILSNVTLTSDNAPTLSIDAQLKTNSKTMTIEQSSFSYGKSDFDLTGELNQWLGLIDTQQVIIADLKVKGHFLDVNEITGTATPTNAAERDSIILASIPKFKTHALLEFDSLNYEDYSFKALNAEVQWNGEKINVLKGNLSAKGSTASMKGQIDNVFGYVFKGENLIGIFDVATDKVFIERWMQAEEGVISDNVSTTQFVQIPENLSFTFALSPTLVKYNSLDFEKLNGKVLIDSGQVSFYDIEAKTLAGSVTANGFYNSLNAAAPTFAVKFAGESRGMHEAFEKLPLVQKFAPVLKLINGVFNSSTVLEGQLGTGYLPIWESLTATGFLETIHSDIGNLEILNKIGEKLSISELTKLKLDGTRNWFEIKKGVLTLKPFSLAVGDIDANLEGTYALTGDIGLSVDLRVPSSIIEKNKLFQAAYAQWQPLQNKLGELGLNVGDLEYADIEVLISGKAKDPIIQWKVKNMSAGNLKKQAGDIVKDKFNQARDSVTQVVEDKVKQVRDSAENYVKNVIDSVEKVAADKVDKFKDTIGQVIKNQVSSVLDSITVKDGGDMIKDILKSDSSQVDKSIEDLKDKLKNFDPFKKKKTGGNE